MDTAEDDISDDLPAPDNMPRIKAETALAAAFAMIGMHWSYFEEDNPEEAAKLLDAAVLAEADYDDALPDAARAVVDWFDKQTDGHDYTGLMPVIDQLRAALPGEEDSEGPSDSDLAAMPDAEKVGGEK